MKIIGREKEMGQLLKAIQLHRNVLIEGPVGVGKTFLVAQVLKKIKLGFERLDGDTRYTEQKLTGWFDPPMVLKNGYSADCFVDGPLLTSMKAGRPLFINELNRMPEAVQNILLPAMDEKKVVVPKLGEIVAKDGFLVLATQNPREFTATHALSEALLDRFEMIRLDYQSRDEEVQILKQEIGNTVKGNLQQRAVDVIRATRQHAAIKRGASVRAALAICKLVEGGIDFESACLMSLPSRMELVSSEENPNDLILSLLANSEFNFRTEKKSELSL